MTAAIHARLNAVFVNFQPLLRQIAPLHKRRAVIRNFQDNLFRRRFRRRSIKILILSDFFEHRQVHARTQHERSLYLRSRKTANRIECRLVVIKAHHDVRLDFARFHLFSERRLGRNPRKPRLCKNAIVLHAQP